MTAPLDIHGAAEAIGVCKRSLDGFLAKHKDKALYRRRGSKRVFYPEHIREIDRLWHSDSIATESPASGKSGELSKGSASERVRARLTRGRQSESGSTRKPGSSMKPSGNVAYLGPRP